MGHQIAEQHFDLASGHHVITLKNEHNNVHIVQIAIGADACPACGHAHAKDNLDSIDPKAMVAAVIEELDKSHAGMLEYAARNGIPVR